MPLRCEELIYFDQIPYMGRGTTVQMTVSASFEAVHLPDGRLPGRGCRIVKNKIGRYLGLTISRDAYCQFQDRPRQKISHRLLAVSLQVVLVKKEPVAPISLFECEITVQPLRGFTPDRGIEDGRPDALRRICVVPHAVKPRVAGLLGTPGQVLFTSCAETHQTFPGMPQMCSSEQTGAKVATSRTPHATGFFRWKERVAGFNVQGRI